MRIYNLFHELSVKFIPGDEVQEAQLQNDAAVWYGNLLQQVKDIDAHNAVAKEYNETQSDKPDFKPEMLKPLSWKLKAVKLLESVPARYLMKAAYVILFGVIQRFMNGERDEVDPVEQERQQLLERLESLKR